MKTKTLIGSLLLAAAIAGAISPAAPALAASARAGEVSLNGSGATFPQPLYEDWAYAYSTKIDTAVKINYSGVGSGQGKKDILAGTVDFAGSDAVLTKDESTRKPLQQVPTVAGAVVPVFNVQGVKDLVLDARTLSGIYLGAIAKWNDPAIARLNPKIQLPNQTIVVVHRSDGSGTTNIFTTYLSVVSEEWRNAVKPPLGTTVDWPVDKLKRGLGGKGNAGVAAAVQKTAGAIGYVELAYAVNNKIPFARMVNAAGNTVTASVETTLAAVKTAWFDERLASTTVNGKEAQAWPIAGFTYIILNKDYQDCEKATKLIQWIVWGVSSPEGKARASKLLYVPLPDEVIPTVGNALKTITCKGTPIFK